MIPAAIEPVLTERDHSAWNTLIRTAKVHSRLSSFKRKVKASSDAIELFSDENPDALWMWSGGKDSTAMVHLASVLHGGRIQCMSEKDDLDFPGEVEYVKRVAESIGADLEIVMPEESLFDWIERNPPGITEDIHGRAAGLSKAHFYGLIEEATGDRPIGLGLRADESRSRRMNANRGMIYTRKCGRVVCQPLAWWSGLDVYAYLVSRDVEILNVYKCIGFMHSSEPWKLRKSWWIPGSSSSKGESAWLRMYYPTLFSKLEQIIDGASILA